MNLAAANTYSTANYAKEVAYLQQLIRFPSVTPDEAGAIAWLQDQLQSRGFNCHRFERNGVTNLIADISFGDGPTVAFCGHIDVVPAVACRWQCDPFAGDIINGEIVGRGAADMKGGVAAMLEATDRLLAHHPRKGRLFWLITSDEEGEAEYGSALIAQQLDQKGVVLDAVLVGEPTATNRVGDTIKNGRRGALSGTVTVTGRAGHVAYPEHTVNAAHIGAQIAVALQQVIWHKDIEGSQTSLQVTGLEVANSLDNLVPAKCEIHFNVRYSHGYRSDDIVTLLNDTLTPWQDTLTLSWQRPCEPYYTVGRDGFDFIATVEKAIYHCTRSYPKLSTSGGTSDGRFFANNYTQVIECGVRNHTIHQDNERVSVSDLASITNIYTQVLLNVFK